MDFKRLSQQAKRLIDRRGGTKSLKEDADELRDIARGEGSLSDKAKAAAEAVKEPGAKGPETEHPAPEQERPSQTP
jgi:general stress protein YciG